MFSMLTGRFCCVFYSLCPLENIVHVFEHIISLIYSPSFDRLSGAYLCIFGCIWLKQAACKYVLGVYRPL